MYTQYDKAIAAFLSSLAGILAAFGLPKVTSILSQEAILAITPFLALVLTWAIKNKPIE